MLHVQIQNKQSYALTLEWIFQIDHWGDEPSMFLLFNLIRLVYELVVVFI
jgi:hypothetical protein